MSWAFQLLPYLEQGAVHNLTTVARLERTPVALYFCPSRRPPSQNPVTLAWQIDYAGVVPIPEPTTIGKTWEQIATRTPLSLFEDFFWGGTGNVHTPNEPSRLRNFCDFSGTIVRSSYYAKTATTSSNLGYQQAVAFKDIEDGASNTILVSEKRLRPSTYATDEWYDDKGWSDGWDPDVMRLAAFPISPDNDQLGLTSGDPNREFGFYLGSAHHSGVNVVFADASVDSLAYGADVAVVNRLAHRADGQVVGKP